MLLSTNAVTDTGYFSASLAVPRGKNLANPAARTLAPYPPGQVAYDYTNGILYYSNGTSWLTTVGSSGSVQVSSFSASTEASTTSHTYVVIDGMTTTPDPGTYIVTFSSSGRGDVLGSSMTYALFVDGTVIGHTIRKMDSTVIIQPQYDTAMHTQAAITVDGSQTISVRYSTSAGTFYVHPRSLMLAK